MAELRASILVNLAGNLQKMADRFSTSLRGIGTAAASGFGRAGTAAGKASDELQRSGGRLALLATGGLGMAALIHGTMTVEQRLERLGVQSNATGDRVKSMWTQIQAVSAAPEIRVDPTHVLGAIEEIVERTGDLNFVAANVRNIAQAIQATGASGGAIGGLMAEFQKMGLNADQVTQAMDAFNAKGKEGSFTMANLAALGPRIVAAYTATSGRTGLDAINEMGSALQVIRAATGSSEQATTAFEALMRTFGDREKVNELRANGIEVFDMEERARTGREIMRPLPDIMRETVERAGGRMTNLSMIFDAEAMRAFNSITAEFLKSGKVTSLEHFMGIQGQGQTADDAARIAKTLQAQTDSGRARTVNAIEKATEKPLQHLFTGAGALLEGKPGEASLEAARAYSETFGKPGTAVLEKFRAGARRNEALDSLQFTQSRLRAEQERLGIGAGAPADGRVTIEVQAAPGTTARIKKLEGRGMDVDSGQLMQGP